MLAKSESALAFLYRGKMELRRPTLADKETILNMMAKTKRQSARDGGFWDAEELC